MLKNIVFDFDGVIANSIEAKTFGFEKLYESYGENIKKKVIDHHLKNGGVSRYKKFVHYHQKFLDISLKKDELNNLCEQYSEIIIDAVINSSFVPGVIDYIKIMKTKVKLFLSTGTPTNEIIYILKKKNIYNLFDGVYGSPSNKIQHIKEIMDEYNLKPFEIIFYGDSSSDLEAAEYHNIEFVLVKNIHNIVLQKQYDGKYINNFLGLS